MYIVFCTQTGEEMNSFERHADAHAYAAVLQYENTWEETFQVRWEA